MTREKPLLFTTYPELKETVPWIPLLTGVPTSIDRLDNLEIKLELNSEGRIYIKRDDIAHHIYGGNKLRKFEFIFGKAIDNNKTGMITIGGIGSNHCLACAIVAKELDMRCDLFLFPQPITWHVQRSLLLYDHFGANLHFSKSFVTLALKVLGFRLTHPKSHLMFPGGSLLFGLGSPIGTLGFVNAIFELKTQIDAGVVDEPDAIFVAGGSGGTAAGLILGCKLLGLKTKVHITAVSMDWIINRSNIVKNASKALKYLREHDDSVPDIAIQENDFEIIEGYLGSDYGVKTERGQRAIDLLMELEGNSKGFTLETTYTGKAMAAMIDYCMQDENKSKNMLFWNTYNSNDLDQYLRETDFNFKECPKKFHQFFENNTFQCWQIKQCPKKEQCPAYLNHEYRCWRVKNCPEQDRGKCKAYRELNHAITLENA
jgi:D-cysteine desulfhydrase